jgi:hypothetical protein
MAPTTGHESSRQIYLHICIHRDRLYMAQLPWGDGVDISLAVFAPVAYLLYSPSYLFNKQTGDFLLLFNDLIYSTQAESRLESLYYICSTCCIHAYMLHSKWKFLVPVPGTYAERTYSIYHSSMHVQLYIYLLLRVCMVVPFASYRSI